jgi:CheY-like chemotaxis protein
MSLPKVLIVDDVEENLILLAFALKAFDLELVKARDGFEAEQRCREESFLLIIMDVHMPGRSGLLAAQTIREETPNKLTPIIFLTADTVANELPRSAYSVGAVDVMYKPLEATRLRSKVQVFLDLYLERIKVIELMEKVAQSQTQLVAQEKAQAVGFLVGSLSHHFNNQLCVAEGHASVLMEQADIEQQESLEKIMTAIDACTKLLDTMQSFTGINNRAEEVDKEQVSVLSMLTDFKGALQAILPDDAQLTLEIAEDAAQRGLLKEAARGILLPVAQFCAEQVASRESACVVRIVAALEAKACLQVQIQVQGEGIILTEDIINAVQDVFGSEDVLVRQQSLGLAAAKNVAEERSGRLDITRQSEGFDINMAWPML